MALVHLDIKPDNIFVCNPEPQLEATVPSDSTANERKESDTIESSLPIYKIGTTIIYI